MLFEPPTGLLVAEVDSTRLSGRARRALLTGDTVQVLADKSLGERHVELLQRHRCRRGRILGDRRRVARLTSARGCGGCSGVVVDGAAEALRRASDGCLARSRREWPSSR